MDRSILVRIFGLPLYEVSCDDFLTVKGVVEASEVEDCYVSSGGKIVKQHEKLNPGAVYTISPRLRGGKGGFGSMLRAIGAQIEKTTNREACRDLSGRRMRDVNNEKKMLDYLAKKAEKEEERERKKKEKLERLTQTPRHFFNDPAYDKKSHEVVENVDKALEKGLVSHSNKRKVLSKGPRKVEPKEKRGLWLGVEDVSDSDSDSDDEEDVQLASSKSRESSSDSEAGASCSKSDKNIDSKDAESSSSKDPEMEVESSKEAEVQPSVEEANIQDSSSKCVEKDEVSSSSKEDEEGSSSIVTSTSEVESTEHPGSPPKIHQDIEDLSSTNETVEKDAVEEEKDSTSDPPSEDSQQKLNPESSEANTSDTKITETKAIEVPDLSALDSIEELENLGLDVLKAALMKKGVKCGGSLKERAQRLFIVKDISTDQIDPSLLAKNSKTKNRSKKGGKKL